MHGTGLQVAVIGLLLRVAQGHHHLVEAHVSASLNEVYSRLFIKSIALVLDKSVDSDKTR